MAKLDYSAFTIPLTETEVADFKRENKIFVLPWWTLALDIILVPLMHVLFDDIMPGIIVASIVFFVLLIVAFATRYSLKRNAMLNKFAVTNRLTFLRSIAPTGYNGMIFDEGHSRVIPEAFRFEDGREIGNHTYITGSGKNQQSHDFGYMIVPLKRRLPHMVLDSKANNHFFGLSTGLTDSFNKSQRLSLEGNFDNFYNLYAPKEYERDALYVFTPDVMQALLDNGNDLDMEIVDDKLYVYSTAKFKLDNQKRIETLLTIADKFGNELFEQSEYYADDRVANSRELNAVGAGGQRLKSSIVPTVIAIVFGVVYFGVWLFSAMSG